MLVPFTAVIIQWKMGISCDCPLPTGGGREHDHSVRGDMQVSSTLTVRGVIVRLPTGSGGKLPNVTNWGRFFSSSRLACLILFFTACSTPETIPAMTMARKKIAQHHFCFLLILRTPQHSPHSQHHPPLPISLWRFFCLFLFFS